MTRLEAYRRAIVERSLPFWAEYGFDRQRSRFRERLDWSGRPLNVPHRVMVQARQIYVFAHAAKLGWYPAGADLAEAATHSLFRHYAEEAQGRLSFHFSLDDQHRPTSSVRDSYAHTFVLFALAALHDLTGHSGFLDSADQIIAFVDAELTDPVHGGLFDAFPRKDDTKRQNPLMHLLEAYLFLAACAPDRDYLYRAAQLVELFKQRLFRARPGVLLEFFGRDWALPAEGGSLFEPGHHFEWVWLLDRFQQMSGKDQSPWIDTLYHVAMESGATAERLIFDEVDLTLSPVKRSHRVWPHSEAIKAAAARHVAGDANALMTADTFADRLLVTFLDRPFPGGWIDHVSENGTPLVDYVPASSLYHLFLAAAEATRAASLVSTNLSPT